MKIRHPTWTSVNHLAEVEIPEELIHDPSPVCVCTYICESTYLNYGKHNTINP